VLTLAGMREANLRRVREVWGHEDDWTPADWLGCVLGELGEVAHALKEARRSGDRSRAPEDGSGLADELADTLLYLDLLAARCGIDLAEAVRAKFNRTSVAVGSVVRL
jgi:NTP pyrophosphatase (non-canonical NTP hydrolase)